MLRNIKIHYVEDGDLPNGVLYPTGKYCLGYVVWAHGWVDTAFFHDGDFWSRGEKIYPEAWCELTPPKRIIKKWGDRSMKTFFKEHKAYYKELLKQWLQTSKAGGCDNINIVADTEQFLKEEK